MAAKKRKKKAKKQAVETRAIPTAIVEAPDGLLHEIDVENNELSPILIAHGWRIVRVLGGEFDGTT